MDCRICGRQFDALGFQVMVPGHQHGFDRVDCALEASVLEPPAPHRDGAGAARRRRAAAIVRPHPRAGNRPRTDPERSERTPALLRRRKHRAPGGRDAATIYLWLRVFGVDAGPVAFLAERASQAFGRTTVAAAVDLTPATEVRPEPENTVRGAGTLPAAAVTSATAPTTPRPNPGRRPLAAQEAGATTASRAAARSSGRRRIRRRPSRRPSPARRAPPRHRRPRFLRRRPRTASPAPRCQAVRTPEQPTLPGGRP